MKEVIKMKFRGKNKRKISKDIQELRLSLGETQKVFGARINVSQTSVMNWEKGRYLPNYAAAKKLSDLYEQTFPENKQSNVSSCDKGQTSTNPDVLDKLTVLAEILGIERLDTNNSLEQYSSKELLEELTRRASKKDDL